MGFQAWHLAAMEEAGYMTTSQGLNNRLAYYLAEYGSNEIGNEEFEHACIACGIDFSSISQDDLDYIQKRLNELTRG